MTSMSICCVVALVQKYMGQEIEPNKIDLEKKSDEFRKPPDEPIKNKLELPQVVKEINLKCSKIKNISFESIDLKLWQGGHRFRLDGTLYYEKPNNFRMEIFSLLGKELDLGSNKQNFWYWSRRDKTPGLHYASHSDLNKTRLKTPFNPMFLKSTLGIEELPSDNFQLVENQNDYMILYPRISATGEPINFTVFVNKERKQIDGYVVKNFAGKSIAACEIQQYSGEIPSKILYTWYEESSIMLMQLNRVKLNGVILEKTWSMPNYSPKYNMAEN